MHATSMSAGVTPAMPNRRGAMNLAPLSVGSIQAFEYSVRPGPYPTPLRYTGGCGRSRARSADVTMKAHAPSDSRQKSSSRRGSEIIREAW